MKDIELKLPSDVIVDAFDCAWMEQNGKLPNFETFKKIFMAVQLLDIYKDITKMGLSENLQIKINYQIREVKK